jgi:hypothetical protein
MRLPAELAIPGRLGPTSFTNVGDAEPMTLGRFRLLFAGHPYAHALVLGTVREPGNVYSALCTEPESGEIVLVDLEPPLRVRFVNSGLDALVACAELFVANYPDPRLRDLLATIDPAALVYEDAFWVVRLAS